jgi:antitoxin (DNA-binding transcriptional repressor) of toxin-antitoxin stability system
MKTASVQEVPDQLAMISGWLAAGEEVEVTQQDQVVAKLVPASRPQPDFLARAKAVWGDQPPGQPLSVLVHDARGGES